MKITIFGLTISSSWGNGHATPYRAIIRALSREGHSVTFFERDLPYYSAHRDLSRCDYCDLVLYDSWMEVRKDALAVAAESDIVMTASYCPEGAQVNDDVLGLTRPLKVYYDLDAPVTLSKLKQSVPVEYVRPDQFAGFDLVLSWTGGQALEDLASEWGARMVRPLFGCVDPDVYFRQPPRNDFECALSYMGTYAEDRQKKVDELFLEPSRRRKDLQFLLAGSLYPFGWSWGENVKKIEHVAPTDHPALYSSSRCALNITRSEMAASGYCPSGRFFEAAACETPIATDWFEGLDHFFDPEVELMIVNTADDVLKQLDRDPLELKQMATRARERTLDEHTGRHRAQQLLNYCEMAHSGLETHSREWLRVSGSGEVREAA